MQPSMFVEIIFLLLGDLRESPSVRVKCVSGTAQAAGIGKIQFTITNREGGKKR